MNKYRLVRRPTQTSVLLDQFEGILIRDFDGASHVPGNMDHGNNRLYFLHHVPLEALQGELILVSCTKQQHRESHS